MVNLRCKDSTNTAVMVGGEAGGCVSSGLGEVIFLPVLWVFLL